MMISTRCLGILAAALAGSCGGLALDEGGGGAAGSVLCQVELGWERAFEGEPGRVLGDAVSTSSGHVVVGRRFDGHAESSTVIALGGRGDTAWEVALERRYSAIARDQGGFVVAGSWRDDWVVTGLDESGEAWWEVAVGTDDEDFVSTIVMDGDSAVVVGSSVHYVGSPADVLVARFGPDGTLEWSRTYGESTNLIGKSRDERVIGAFVDASGRVVIAVQQWRDGSDGPPWVFALEDDGRIAWEHLHDREFERGSSWSLVPTAAGGSLLAGTVRSDDGFSGSAHLLRFDAEGALVDETPLSDRNDHQQVIADAIELRSGGFALLGYSSQSTMGRLWRLRDDGSILWTRDYPGVDAGFARIVEMPAGGFALGRAQWALEGDDFVEVIRTDARGAPLWRHAAYGSGVAFFGALNADPAGRLLAVGGFSKDEHKGSKVALLSERCAPR